MSNPYFPESVEEISTFVETIAIGEFKGSKKAQMWLKSATARNLLLQVCGKQASNPDVDLLIIFILESLMRSRKYQESLEFIVKLTKTEGFESLHSSPIGEMFLSLLECQTSLHEFQGTQKTSQKLFARICQFDEMDQKVFLAQTRMSCIKAHFYVTKKYKQEFDSGNLQLPPARWYSITSAEARASAEAKHPGPERLDENLLNEILSSDNSESQIAAAETYGYYRYKGGADQIMRLSENFIKSARLNELESRLLELHLQSLGRMDQPNCHQFLVQNLEKSADAEVQVYVLQALAEEFENFKVEPFLPYLQLDSGINHLQHALTAMVYHNWKSQNSGLAETNLKPLLTHSNASIRSFVVQALAYPEFVDVLKIALQDIDDRVVIAAERT